MPTTLITYAIERSTRIIEVTFTDEEGAAVIPNDLTWSLVNEDEEVVNSRVSVIPAVLDSTVNIVLSGADLDIADGDERTLVIEGHYDSDIGNDLPFRDQVTFRIQGLAI